MADFADYYREIYARGLGGETPSIPVAVEEQERRAHEAMDERAANYVFAGAGAEHTMRANRDAFERYRIVPRMLRDVAERDLSIELLGTAMPAPLMLAPIGVQKVVHEDGELATRPRAAAAVGRADDRQHRLALHPGGDRRGRRATRRAGSSSTGPTTASWRRASSAAPRPPATARSWSRRHLRPRLEAARPAAGLAALPPGDGHRQLPLQDPVFRAALREAAGGGPGRGDRPLPRRVRQPVADLGRPGVAARADLAADPASRASSTSTTPARRSRRGHRRHRRLQPRRPPGRRRDRLARRAAADRRGGRRRAGDPLRQRHPRRRRRAQGARPRRRRRLPRPPLRLGPRARRPGTASRPCSRWSSPSST